MSVSSNKAATEGVLARWQSSKRVGYSAVDYDVENQKIHVASKNYDLRRV